MKDLAQRWTSRFPPARAFLVLRLHSRIRDAQRDQPGVATVSALQVPENSMRIKVLEQMAPDIPRDRDAVYRRGSALTESDIPILDELEELLGPSVAEHFRERAERRRRSEAAGGR